MAPWLDSGEILLLSFPLRICAKIVSLHGRNARHPGNDVDANSSKISICSLLRFVWMWLGSRSCVTDGVEAEEGFGMLLFDSWSIPCSKFLTNHVCICFMEILKGLLTPSEALLRSCVSMVGGMGSLAFPCFFFFGGGRVQKWTSWAGRTELHCDVHAFFGLVLGQHCALFPRCGGSFRGQRHTVGEPRGGSCG